MRSFFAIFAAVLAFIQVAAAIPPACLLAALGVQDNPSDLKAVCGDLQDAIQGNITQNCHTDMAPKAYEVYSSKCLEQGVTVAALPTSTSSSASQSSTGSASSTGTGPASNSATPTDAASGTTGGDSTSNTGSGSSPSPTTNAGMATGPQPFVYAAAALLATGLTSVIFL
ncbi:hypothetical protein F5Y04DRAFT_245778 [Hypomontagnella monticulosa]|nr:hypothetical protein F5Y04DRAFT_245778 [Hypomontagnella monticulosa]